MTGTQINTIITKFGEFETNEDIKTLRARAKFAEEGECKDSFENPYVIIIQTVIWERSYWGKLVKIIENVAIDVNEAPILFIRNQVIEKVVESPYDEILKKYPDEINAIRKTLTPLVTMTVKSDMKKRMMNDITVDIKNAITEEMRKEAYTELNVEILEDIKEQEEITARA